MPARPAAGGGRWIDVDPHRLPRWLDGFYSRHGGAAEEGLLLTAPNGDIARLLPPPGVGDQPDIDSFLAAVRAPRRLGLLLARKGAVAVGDAEGDRLRRSKVETWYVQGRTAAGGWSQQRYARRRANQADAGVQKAADIVATVLLPVVAELTALVCGGDRFVVDAILADRRLAPLAALRHERLLDVPEPRYVVLVDAVAAARAVHIHLLP